MKSALANVRPPTSARRNLDVTPIHRVNEANLLGQFIPLHYHAQMLSNEPRMAAFHEAIARIVPPNGNVVDLGGGTGVLSFFAAERARRVTLVERLPHVAAAARHLLAANGVSSQVTVVEADARDYVPDEPADVVLCEMLHSGLLREKQVEVIKTFRSAHVARFHRDVPRVIPEAAILAFQPVFQPYYFHGYYAPVPYFCEAGSSSATTVEMGQPWIYATLEFGSKLSEHLSFRGMLTIEHEGTVNALRFVTKVLVGMFPEEQATVDWHLPYMILPVPSPLSTHVGDLVDVSFEYQTGGSIESLQSSIKLERL